jgi:hypothetical protein
MFGKPEWFRDKKIGWGLVPIAWQGWVYTAAWGAVISGPFLLLASQHKGLEAGIWMGAMMASLFWDVRQIKRARNAPPVAAKKEPVLYIGDDDVRSVSTKNLDLQLRR